MPPSLYGKMRIFVCHTIMTNAMNPRKAMGLVLLGGLSASAIAVAVSHTAGSPAAPQPAAISRVTAARTNVENPAPADRRYYPNEFVRRHYPGCRILDRDHDDGCTEIKIRHNGQEKIVLFNHNRWVRTLWEVRRERLPKRVVQALAAAGFGYRSLDDNDNYVMENRRGRFYAVQVQRHDDDDSYYLVSASGRIINRFSDDDWCDGHYGCHNNYRGGCCRDYRDDRHRNFRYNRNDRDDE